jgi:hypothetical protein
MRASAPSLIVLCITISFFACDRAAPTSVGRVEADVARLRSLPRIGVIKAVPFRAEYTFQTVPGPIEPCGTSGRNRTFVEGQGEGTHLGSFTIRLSQCGLADGVLADGRGTFVAANGDLLHFTYTGQTTRTPILITFVSFVTFAGGTGRFEASSGTATTLGSIDLLTAATVAEWEGSLSSVGSNKQ